jgi:hypothetical protein
MAAIKRRRLAALVRQLPISVSAGGRRRPYGKGTLALLRRRVSTDRLQRSEAVKALPTAFVQPQQMLRWADSVEKVESNAAAKTSLKLTRSEHRQEKPS